MFWRRKRSVEDFREEIRSHLELEGDELKEDGIAAQDAPYAARRAFGNVTSAEEKYYERSRVLWWDHFKQDLRYAFRTFRLAPAFTIAAVATLALGIGANTAIFSVFRAVLLKPLPYQDADRITVLEPYWKNRGRTSSLVSAPDFHDWRNQNRVFEYTAYHAGREVTAIVNGRPVFTGVRIATPDFFAVFGHPLGAGRFWTAQEDRNPVAVVSNSWAQEHFGEAGKSLGQAVRVDGKALTIIGVAAPGFRFPNRTDIWMPAGLVEENQHRSGHNYFAIAKLRAGVSLASAREEMRAIGDRLEREYPENRLKTAAVTPLQQRLTQSSKYTLWILMAAVLAVLLIACANVANLQLARSATRIREMAVRAAIGAGRGRLMRQLLTESLLLALLGAIAGAGVAAVVLRGLTAIAPGDLLRLDEARIDPAVFSFALVLAAVSGLVFGLAPALRFSRSNAGSGLYSNNTKGRVGRISNRTRSALVISQVALSVILLAGAGLLLRSFDALSRVDLGFSMERLLLVTTSIPAQSDEDSRRATIQQRDLLQRVASIPGVRQVAGIWTMPFGESRSNGSYWIGPAPATFAADGPSGQLQVATPGYFAALGMKLLRGRDFSDSDSWGRPQVAIINETLAREAFGDASPLGHMIGCGMTMESAKGMQIVGVVSNVRQIDPGQPPQPEIYMPYLQHPGPGSNLKWVVQTALEPVSLTEAIRETVRRADPELPLRFSTVQEVYSSSLSYPRFRAVLLGCFAFFAMCLAVVGIYGVISYLVTQRTSEIGLRFALGARPGDVFSNVIGDSVRLVGAGLLLGLAGIIALSQALRSMLFGVSPNDPATLAAVVVVLLIAALAASSIPALRAARVDPSVALRQE